MHDSPHAFHPSGTARLSGNALIAAAANVPSSDDDADAAAVDRAPSDLIVIATTTSSTSHMESFDLLTPDVFLSDSPTASQASPSPTSSRASSPILSGHTLRHSPLTSVAQANQPGHTHPPFTPSLEPRLLHRHGRIQNNHLLAYGSRTDHAAAAGLPHPQTLPPIIANNNPNLHHRAQVVQSPQLPPIRTTTSTPEVACATPHTQPHLHLNSNITSSSVPSNTPSIISAAHGSAVKSVPPMTSGTITADLSVFDLDISRPFMPSTLPSPSPISTTRNLDYSAAISIAMDPSVSSPWELPHLMQLHAPVFDQILQPTEPPLSTRIPYTSLSPDVANRHAPTYCISVPANSQVYGPYHHHTLQHQPCSTHPLSVDIPSLSYNNQATSHASDFYPSVSSTAPGSPKLDFSCGLSPIVMDSPSASLSRSPSSHPVHHADIDTHYHQVQRSQPSIFSSVDRRGRDVRVNDANINVHRDPYHHLVDPPGQFIYDVGDHMYNQPFQSVGPSHDHHSQHHQDNHRQQWHHGMYNDRQPYEMDQVSLLPPSAHYMNDVSYQPFGVSSSQYLDQVDEYSRPQEAHPQQSHILRGMDRNAFLRDQSSHGYLMYYGEHSGINDSSAPNAARISKAISATVFNPTPEHSLYTIYDSVRQADRIYQCPNPLCTKRYKDKNGLKYHLNYGNCEHEISVPSNHATPPNTHLVTDTITSQHHPIKITNRPYRCRACDRRYKNAGGLKYHARMQHPHLDFDLEVKGT